MTEPTAMPEAADVRVVGAVARLVAYVLDALLVALATYVVLLLLHTFIGPTVRITDVDGVPRLSVDRVRFIVDTLVATGMSAAYFVGSWLTWGRTPAQRVIRARVERAADGGRLWPIAAVTRWLLLGAPFGLISALLLPGPGSGAILGVVIALYYAVLFITTARDARKRGLHDRVAGSIVRRR